MAVETKVQASAGAAAVSGLALWSLGHWVFKGVVPDVVASWVYAAVPGVLAFGAGYLAKHTYRPAVPPVVMMAAPAHAAGNMPADIPAGTTAPVPAEKPLIPPAAAATEPPAVAGEPPA